MSEVARTLAGSNRPTQSPTVMPGATSRSALPVRNCSSERSTASTGDGSVTIGTISSWIGATVSRLRPAANTAAASFDRGMLSRISNNIFDAESGSRVGPAERQPDILSEPAVPNVRLVAGAQLLDDVLVTLRALEVPQLLVTAELGDRVVGPSISAEGPEEVALGEGWWRDGVRMLGAQHAWRIAHAEA
jgi:hypothetical protein